nr:capsid protein [Porcine associated smacovirus]
MVFVKISETFDLSTKVNKMGIVGIHTPGASDLIARHWRGLYMNYKQFRFARCDVAMACASMLPADPLQIGVDAGDIAPQDMFNPILYKAVSNDSMNTFLQFLYGQDIDPNSGVVALDKGSIIDVHDTDFLTNEGAKVDQFNMYYGLLSNSSGWKKAMPQSGLSMKGLYPLVFQRLSNVGYTGQQIGDSAFVPEINESGVAGAINTYAHSLRGHAVRMPFVPTTRFVGAPADSNIAGSSISHTMDSGDLPPCYVGLIVLPPAKLNQLYYRLKVTWTIEFTGLRSLLDIGNWSTIADAGSVSYGTDYSQQAKSMTSVTNTVDTVGADVTKIMDGSM